MSPVHDFDPRDHEVLAAVADWIAARMSDASTAPAVPGPRREDGAGLPALSRDGIGLEAAWRALRDAVLPSAFPTDHPRYLAFVGGAPTPASVLADAALSAAAVYGGSELEAGTAVHAERAALAWLCRELGYPADAHGAFVSGGSTANLSALVAARHGRVAAHGRAPGIIVAGASAHSSVHSAAAIMGCTIVTAGEVDTVLRGAELEAVLDTLDPGDPGNPADLSDLSDVVAVVASAGATNTGGVDALAEIAEVCARRGLWLHVDAAYGGAAVLAPACRPLFRGIERADSVTVDPHKWLFTPLDCAAVLYRDPARARAAHRQHADYLDAVNEDESDNPADYAVHLTRRARGVPLWASLLAHGTDAYVAAVEHCLALTDHAAARIEESASLRLVTDPQLSVVLFERTGWSAEEHERWSHRTRMSGLGLVTPTRFRGRTVLRFCFVNPRTRPADIDVILDSLDRTAQDAPGGVERDAVPGKADG